MYFSSLPCLLHAPPISTFSIWWPYNMRWILRLTKCLIIQFYSLSSYLFPFRSISSSQHLVPQHHQSKFFP
jgi:hypothetical protein